MEAFGKIWDANAMLIGIACTVLAIGIAAALNMGTVATIFGLIGGMGFMWVGKPVHAEGADDDDDEA